MYRLKLAIAALPLLLALGCATNQVSMSDAQRKAIRSVSIEHKVVMPPYPSVVGKSTQSAGFWGGPLLMVASMNAQSPDVQQFQRLLEDNKIDVGAIVLQEFVAGLAAAKAFPEVVAEGGDARFELTVKGYGLAPGFSMSPTNKPVKPTLWLVAKLSGRDGSVLWENSENISNMNHETDGYVVDAYYEKPALVAEQFQKAAQIVVRELLKSLAPGS